MDRSQPATTNLMDMHNRLIADILTRYRTLMMLATVQAEDERNNATPETVAVARIALKMEFDGLYSSVKELIVLSRRIKELWLFGPLGEGDPNRKAKDAQIDRDATHVARLLNDIETDRMKALAESNAGIWEPLTKGLLDLATAAQVAAGASMGTG